jgi:glutaminyl-tRNA synthetase
MAVLRPLRVVLENYPEELVEEFEGANHPQDPAMGSRKVPFSKVLYIEEDEFQEDPPKGFFRLAPGREVRLRYAYIITCAGVVKDETGRITEVRCTVDHQSRGGAAADGRKIKGTIHWVSAGHAAEAEVRLYDRLLRVPNPSGNKESDWKGHLNPDSVSILNTCRVEPSLAAAAPGERFQFERQGYFCTDPDTAGGKLVFNRTVTLRDSWTKAGQGDGKSA